MPSPSKREPTGYTIEAEPRSDGAHQVNIDDSWRPLLNEIVTLKDALDHVMLWKQDGESQEWLRNALEPFELAPSDFAPALPLLGPCTPDLFVQMLLGGNFRRTVQAKHKALMVLPPWAVLGWVRKNEYREMPMASREELLARVASIKDWQRPGAYPEEIPHTEFWDGFPLFMAAEGKNRAQLHRLAGVDRMAPVVCMPFPSVEGFVARPMIGLPWAVVVESNAFPARVLPFRRLTEPLVKKLGLRWDARPSWTDLNALASSIAANRNGGRPRWRHLVRWWRHPKALRLALVAGSHAAEVAVSCRSSL